MASDLGILLHTVVMAWLLSRKKLVALSGLPWRELMKALVTAVVAGVLCYAVARRVVLHGSWRTDLRSLALIGADLVGDDCDWFVDHAIAVVERTCAEGSSLRQSLSPAPWWSGPKAECSRKTWRLLKIDSP